VSDEASKRMLIMTYRPLHVAIRHRLKKPRPRLSVAGSVVFGRRRGAICQGFRIVNNFDSNQFETQGHAEQIFLCDAGTPYSRA